IAATCLGNSRHHGRLCRVTLCRPGSARAARPPRQRAAHTDCPLPSMKLNQLTFALLSCLALASLAPLPARAADSQGGRYSERADVKSFIAEMRQKHEFPETWLIRQFDAAEFKPAVIKYILPPADPQVRSWKNYRNRFVEPRRIAAGLAFWKEHAAAIRRASEQYGVPEEII